MLEDLLQRDTRTFIYLNSLGTESFDGFWMAITAITSWIPLFLFFALILLKKFPIREASLKILFLVLLALFITAITHWAKLEFARLRPNNDEAINASIRILKNPLDFSFFSGHASSSFAITLLIHLFLRSQWKWSIFFFIWPVLFSYSRIYVGVHFPLDILVGAVVGLLSGLLFYGTYQFIIPYLKLAHHE